MYVRLSDEVKERIEQDRANHVVNPYAFKDENVVRRDMSRDRANILRPAFVRDVNKIMNIPYYTRYADKTQVFSLHKNDDISRRAFHVQLVANTARNIGRLLNLNLDLIEAIALGHDLGHTPFGHAGEKKLNEIYHSRTGRYFNHNIQSARILDTIFPVNVSLQTLDGIICHNGELKLKKYVPETYDTFGRFEEKMNMCLNEKGGVKKLIPNTLEGCVVRVSDIIAYVGKDRQDAIKLGLIKDNDIFSDLGIGKINAEIISNIVTNIVENSYGKSYLKMDDEYFEAFSLAKKENYSLIYLNNSVEKIFDETIYPMFDEVYEKLYDDLVNHRTDSVIYKHHIDYIKGYTSFYDCKICYEELDPDDIVTDAIASMTDDYFVDLYNYLFPDKARDLKYVGYFE